MNRAIIYFHFDAHGWVDGYVHEVLRSLRAHASHLLVVSSARLSQPDRDRLSQGCDELIVRANVGYDVWAYKDGIEHLRRHGLERFDELVLMNYTFFAPMTPWADLFETTDTWSDISFWGLTDHRELRPHPFLPERSMPRHLNSHWLAVRRTLLVSPEFQQYWDQMPQITSYRDSIQWHESRFTKHFEALGHHWRAVYPAERYGVDNPSVEDPLGLLRDGCPILKRRVFFHDPLHLELSQVDGPKVLRAAREAGFEEALVLGSVSRTAVPRHLIVNAGLTEVLTPPRDTPEESQPAHSGIVLADGGVQDLSELLEQIDVVPSSWPLVLPVASAQRADELATRLEGGDRPVRPVVMPASGRTALATLADRCDDLLDPGRFELVLRVGPPEPAAVARHQTRRSLLSCADSFRAACQLFCDHPNLGMVLPVAPHAGTGILGHGWGQDAARAQAIADAAGLSTPLDPATPLAPYDGVFLARTRALRSILPLATADGGAGVGSDARLRDLLTCYAVLSNGWHCRQVMTPAEVAGGYPLLELKYQALAEHLPALAEDQVPYLRARTSGVRGLGAAVRTTMTSRFPGVADALKPAYRRVIRLRSRSPRR